MPSVNDPIAAVDEADAQGETAALFADIRNTLGVPVVNLVWRHLATLRDGLAWAWGAVRPFYASGAAAREGAALLAELALPPLPRWSRAALRDAGVDAAAESTIVTVFDGYNRSNAMNLVALAALSVRLREPVRGPAVGGGAVARRGPAGCRGAVVPPAAAVAPPAIDGAMPSLLAFAQLAPATADLVHALDALGGGGPVRIPASMYRHLAHWPGFLRLARELLVPLDEDGRLATLSAAARLVARRRRTGERRSSPAGRRPRRGDARRRRAGPA
jgi:hypothetical protein